MLAAYCSASCRSLRQERCYDYCRVETPLDALSILFGSGASEIIAIVDSVQSYWEAGLMIRKTNCKILELRIFMSCPAADCAKLHVVV